MAIKRAEIREIFGDIEGVTDSHISKLMGLIHTEVDTVKDERDELKTQLDDARKNGGADSDKWKSKYESEHKAFEDYKSEQVGKETKAKKLEAFKKLLEDTELSDKGKTMASKYTSLDDLELDDKGEFTNAKELLKNVSEEWKDYATASNTNGASTRKKDGATTVVKGQKMTKADIMKITDANERQKAIAENPDVFGIG